MYLDACCFIDAVKQEVGTLPSDREDDVWHIKKLLEASSAGDIEVITSTLSIAECVAAYSGQIEVPKEVQDHFRRLLTSGQYVTLAPQTPKTGRIIQDLRWKHGIVLRGADSLHIATAIEREALEFVSTDERLKNPKLAAASEKLAAHNIKLIRAADTLELPDRFRQGAFDA